MYKLIMNSIPFLVVVFLCKIFVSQTIVWDENSLSRPVITRNHRRLKGFTFNTFPSASLVSCGLKCQRNPRCVSTNFRRVSSLDETEGVCELNKMSALQLSIQLIEGKEPEYDEEAVYTQFYDIKVRRMLCVQKRKKKKKQMYADILDVSKQAGSHADFDNAKTLPNTLNYLKMVYSASGKDLYYFLHQSILSIQFIRLPIRYKHFLGHLVRCCPKGASSRGKFC